MVGKYVWIDLWVVKMAWIEFGSMFSVNHGFRSGFLEQNATGKPGVNMILEVWTWPAPSILFEAVVWE